MPHYVCAVADCDSASYKTDEHVRGWATFPKKGDGMRRSLWITRCKRGAKWKNTRNHAICSRHFIDWNQGPTQAHPDPELFAYNNWGKTKYIRRSTYKRQKVEHAPTETSISQAASDRTEAITERCSQEALSAQPQDEVHHMEYLRYDQEIQATVEVSSNSADSVSHVPPSKYLY